MRPVSLKKLGLSNKATEKEYQFALRAWLTDNLFEQSKFLAKIKKDREKARKLRLQKYKHVDDLRKLKNMAWRLTSELVRRTGAMGDYNACFTCRRVRLWKEMNAGHFKHNKLDYDLDNLKPQCIYCNNFLSGNMGKYRAKLIKLYGEQWVESLEARASQAPPYTIEQVKEVIARRKRELALLPH